MNDVTDYKLESNSVDLDTTFDRLDSLQQTLGELASQNVQYFDPIRFRRMESLLRRAAEKQDAVADRLIDSVRQLLSDYMSESNLAHQQAQAALAGLQGECSGLQEQLHSGDIKGVMRQVLRLQYQSSGSPLADLLAAIEQRSDVDNEMEEHLSFEGLLRKQEVDALRQFEDNDALAELDALLPARELKTLQEFREAWAKRSTEKAVAKALDEAPEDAGPLNSHRLVVRSLIAMQEISPEYLGRFVNHIETLLWLEQAGARMLAKVDKIQDGKSKSGSGRGR